MDGKVWLSLALLVALGVPRTAFADSAPMVSITALLANPAKFSGKTVLVTGYYLFPRSACLLGAHLSLREVDRRFGR